MSRSDAMTRARRFAASCLPGRDLIALGVCYALYLLGRHVYIDHHDLHVLVDRELAREGTARAASPTTTTTATTTSTTTTLMG